jgi:probable biosynthetic protein (TIGR04099 family)
LGTVQLGLVGITEQWLLRHLCSLHMRAIETETGVPRKQWVANGGRHRVHPVVVATDLCFSLGATWQEGETLGLSSRLERVRPDQFLSTHTLLGCSSGAWGRVEVISTFARRANEEDNAELVRGVSLEWMAQASPPTGREIPLVDLPDAVEQGLARPPNSTSTIWENRLPIDPAFDFTPARLFGTGGYIKLIDTAESAAWPSEPTYRWPLLTRRVAYSGNLNPQDAVTVHLAGSVAHGRVSHLTTLRRASDGRTIAAASTTKAFVS